MPVILGILFAIFLALLTPDTWARSPESPVGGWLWAEERLLRPFNQLRPTGDGVFGPGL